MVFLSLVTLMLTVPATVDDAQAAGIYCKERLVIPHLLVLTNDIGETVYNVIDMRGDDTVAIINGTEGIDLILAPDSGVEIMAKGGSDCIIGGDGDDIIYGDETMRIGGDDYIHGNDGNDSISAGGGNDWVDGGSGDDALYGNNGDDRLRGGPGNDIMVGGPGYNTIVADLDDEQYQKPEDSIHIEETDDSVNDDKDPQTKPSSDQSEQDKSSSSLSREIAAEPTYCKENLTISELVDGRYYNVIDERNGNKAKIKGTGGDDLILAHDGGTEILGKKGNDCIIGGAGNDLIKGNKGNDHIYGGDGADDLRGNLGDDVLVGDADDKRIAGGQGSNDTCTDTPNTKSNCENLN